MANKLDRRKFLQLSALSTPLLMSKKALANQITYANSPIVISTWDSGMAVNAAAWKILSKKGRALDAIEAGANQIEDTINCCVGLGGNPDRDGIVTLDACIMDEHFNCGAVAGMEQIKHPISVARKLMENTPHVLLVGNGAQQFAIENGFAKEPAKLSESAENTYKEWLKKTEYKPQINIERNSGNGPFAPNFFTDGTPNHDTMGLLAKDSQGNLSGGVTTSGMAFKLHGRVGDSAGIGAGLYVDNEVGAATSSGVGEEVIRTCGTHLVVELMRQGLSPEKACKKAVERIIKINPERAKTLQVGYLAMNKNGEYGAYAIQKGFVFSVKTNDENKIHESKFILGA
jgi:N4-(beta-N-acetylglucosaminyl)-L-asparaginase